MPPTKTAPYGSWPSPITAEHLSSAATRLSEPKIHAGEFYWLESRPAEQGRCVPIAHNHGQPRPLLPAEFSVRTRAHEYGGGAWTVGGNCLFFVNESDQRIYATALDKPTQPVPLTPPTPCRYADLQYHPATDRLIAVAEDHSDSNAEPLASLIAISANAQTAPHTLQSGADFYSTPRLSPDGNDLLWLQWNHPDMPWTRNELWYAPLNAPAKAKKLVAGDESIFQPQFSPTGRIHYVSDRNNWWNLYEYRPAAPDRCLVPAERECGLPQWQFGMSTWGFIAPDKILAAYSANGTWSLYQLNLTTGKEHKIAADYNYLSHLATDPASGRALIIAASPQQPEHLCTVKTTSKTDADKTEKIRPLFTDHPPQSPVSQAQSITFAAANGTPVHGFFYPPHNAAYRAPPDDRPPLLVLCHGGPTAATNAAFNLAIQFWTSRGFAVTDINYRGSTGFGRAYRLSLDGHWGIYDVADACAAAEYCAAQGWVARDKCIIRGSSAGGYTVLSALCFHNTFAAGCSRYGIGDLKALAADTHKFESRYTDRLIAPPTDTATYAARSPINHVEKFSCPTLFFQGLKDRVVPPEQSKKMATALKKAGFPVCLITYPDEAHGFRNAPNITHALNTELAFYGTVFGIKTDSPITNLKIANLPTTRPKPAS